MRVTAILVNWNTRTELLAALQALSEAPDRPDEIIVVDNGSTDGSAQAAAEALPTATVISLGENVGYSEGNNLAVRCATGDALLFLNPDTVMPPGGVETLTRFLEDHPRAGLAAPRLVLPDGSTQRSVRGMPTPVALLSATLGLDRLFPRHPVLAGYRLPVFDYTKAQPAPQPMASVWLVRREAWDDVGPFDTRFPLFWNDVDWCLRAEDCGWEIWYTPEPAVLHTGGASTRQVKPAAIRESHRALVAFYRKHYGNRLGVFALKLCETVISAAGFVRAAFCRRARV